MRHGQRNAVQIAGIDLGGGFQLGMQLVLQATVDDFQQAIALANRQQGLVQLFAENAAKQLHTLHQHDGSDTDQAMRAAQTAAVLADFLGGIVR